MGIELPASGKIPLVVGAASGPHNARAIPGALCGHYVNLFVTDDLTGGSCSGGTAGCRAPTGSSPGEVWAITGDDRTGRYL